MIIHEITKDSPQTSICSLRFAITLEGVGSQGLVFEDMFDHYYGNDLINEMTTLI